MTVVTIPGQSIRANIETDSPATVLPTGVTNVQVQLTDPASVWDTTNGHIKQWGIQKSTDGGATWEWLLFQGHPTNPALWLAFGSRSRQGAMPLLNLTGSALSAASGDRLRLAIVTDIDIVLGAQLTTS